MKIHEAVEYCLAYHRSNSQINTLRSYEFLLSKFEDFFGDGDLEEISSEGVLSFLTQLCEGNMQGTKRSRYGLLSAFFNLIKNSTDPDLKNPCDTSVLRKAYRKPKYGHWPILEKDVVDEIIFKIPNPRDRLLLELMANRYQL